METLVSQRFPEVVEDYLGCGHATRIALSRRGNLGVTGLNDGRIVLYDLNTKLPRGVCAKEDAHGQSEGAAVVSLSFSRDSRYVASAGKDNVVKIWDAHTLKLLCQKEFREQPIVKIEHIHNIGQCVVSFENAVPLICDCNTKQEYSLLPSNITFPCRTPKQSSPSSCLPAVAATDRKRHNIVVVTANGIVLVYSSKFYAGPIGLGLIGTKEKVRDLCPKSVCFDRRSQKCLITTERGISLYDFGPVAPLGKSRAHENRIRKRRKEAQALASQAIEKPDYSGNASGTRIEQLLPLRQFDVIYNTSSQNRAQLANISGLSELGALKGFSNARFSSTAEFVLAGAVQKTSTKSQVICVWAAASGRLLKCLTAPGKLVQDMEYHPFRQTLYSVSNLGVVYIWTRKMIERWTAFDPTFRELEENSISKEKSSPSEAVEAAIPTIKDSSDPSSASVAITSLCTSPLDSNNQSRDKEGIIDDVSMEDESIELLKVKKSFHNNDGNIDPPGFTCVGDELNSNAMEESSIDKTLSQEKAVGIIEPEQDDHSPRVKLEDSNTSRNMVTSPRAISPTKTSYMVSKSERDQSFVSRVKIAAGIEQMDENRERQGVEGDIDISRYSKDPNYSDSDLSDFSAHTLQLQFPCEMHERLKEVKALSCPAPRARKRQISANFKHASSALPLIVDHALSPEKVKRKPRAQNTTKESSQEMDVVTYFTKVALAHEQHAKLVGEETAMKFMRNRRRTLKALETRVRKLEKEYDENSKKRKALRNGVEESLELEMRMNEAEQTGNDNSASRNSNLTTQPTAASVDMSTLDVKDNGVLPLASQSNDTSLKTWSSQASIGKDRGTSST